MANETEYSNAVNVDAFLEAEIAENLRSALVITGKTFTSSFMKGSDSKKLPQRGTFSATTATESAAHAKSEYTQSLLATLQVAEVKVYAELSDKGRDFSSLSLAEMADEAAKAVADKVEQDALALADGFSTTVGSTTVDLTPQVLRSATYNLRANKVPGPYIIILHPTQIDDVIDDIQTATAAIWGGPNVNLSLLSGRAPEQNGFAGTYLGVDVYETTNVESINSNADWAGLACNPMKALAFGEDGRSIRVETGRNVQSGLTELAVNMYYDWKEYQDAAGVLITSDQ